MMSKRDGLFGLIICVWAMIFKFGAISPEIATVSAAGTLTATVTLSPGLIAFTSDRDGIPSIYAMKADGSAVQRLTGVVAKQNVAQNPAWSPDGQQIAYFSPASTDRQGGLYVIDLTTGKERLVAPDVISPSGFANHPAWSPDGKQIAFAGIRSASEPNTNLYIIDADGQNEYILVQGGPVASNSGSNLGPAWSPDGRLIAYWTTTPTNGKGDTGTISLVAPDGSSQRQISNNGAAPAWSPDGKHIVYTSRLQLFIMDADGRNLRQIARATGGLLATSPTWSADGRQIAYAVGNPSTTGSSGTILYKLFIVDITGDNLHALIPVGGSDTASNGNPAWSPAGVKSPIILLLTPTGPATAAATLRVTPAR